MGKARVALLSLVRNGLAFVVVKPTRVKGRVYALTTQDAQAMDTVVTGILPLFSTHARVLLVLVPHIILFLVPY